MNIKILKNRSDIGAGTRGSDLGIDALEIAAINTDNHFFNNFPYEDIETHNESIYNKFKNPFAKRIGHVVEQCQRVCDAIEYHLANHYFPVLLSGDHSSALGTISGIKKHFQDVRIGVIWIDAHADIHTPYTSPSGNIHGMPLAAALSMDNKHLGQNSVDFDTAHYWERLKNMGRSFAKILPEDLIYFGVRDTQEPENQIIAEKRIRNYTVAEMRFRGIEVCVAEALNKLVPCEYIYISFDVDSMDADAISLGTGTPVSKGFDDDEVKKILKILAHTQKIVCFECVEINPLLDTGGNRMAEVAFGIIEDFVRELITSYKPGNYK